MLVGPFLCLIPPARPPAAAPTVARRPVRASRLRLLFRHSHRRASGRYAARWKRAGEVAERGRRRAPGAQWQSFRDARARPALPPPQRRYLYAGATTATFEHFKPHFGPDERATIATAGPPGCGSGQPLYAHAQRPAAAGSSRVSRARRRTEARQGHPGSPEQHLHREHEVRVGDLEQLRIPRIPRAP